MLTSCRGRLIGRVGSTGLATGPHLHYELKKDGAHVNPLAEHRKLPPGDPVPPDQIEEFKAERDKAMASRCRLDGQNVTPSRVKLPGWLH